MNFMCVELCHCSSFYNSCAIVSCTAPRILSCVAIPNGWMNVGIGERKSTEINVNVKEKSKHENPISMVERVPTFGAMAGKLLSQTENRTQPHIRITVKSRFWHVNSIFHNILVTFRMALNRSLRARSFNSIEYFPWVCCQTNELFWFYRIMIGYMRTYLQHEQNGKLASLPIRWFLRWNRDRTKWSNQPHTKKKSHWSKKYTKYRATLIIKLNVACVCVCVCDVRNATIWCVVSRICFAFD